MPNDSIPEQHRQQAEGRARKARTHAELRRPTAD